MVDDRLPGPYELLDLPDGGTVSFHYRGAREGTMPITLKGSGIQKIVPVMRVIVAAGDKTSGPPFWDITSTLLITHLLADFKRADAGRVKWTIKKIGVAPSARFSVTVTP